MHTYVAAVLLPKFDLFSNKAFVKGKINLRRDLFQIQYSFSTTLGERSKVVQDV
jgi:hypothetical protein